MKERLQLTNYTDCGEGGKIIFGTAGGPTSLQALVAVHLDVAFRSPARSATSRALVPTCLRGWKQVTWTQNRNKSSLTGALQAARRTNGGNGRRSQPEQHYPLAEHAQRLPHVTSCGQRPRGLGYRCPCSFREHRRLADTTSQPLVDSPAARWLADGLAKPGSSYSVDIRRLSVRHSSGGNPGPGTQRPEVSGLLDLLLSRGLSWPAAHSSGPSMRDA